MSYIGTSGYSGLPELWTRTVELVEVAIVAIVIDVGGAAARGILLAWILEFHDRVEGYWV